MPGRVLALLLVAGWMATAGAAGQPMGCVYAEIKPAVARFTLKPPGDYPFSTDHPPSYNVVDWW